MSKKKRKSIGCRVGIHKFGQWESGGYISSCTEIRRCLRCGEKDKKVKIFKDGKYRIVKSHGVPKIKQHSFGGWEYFKDGSCLKQSTCEECGLTETTSHEEHSFPKFWAKEIGTLVDHCFVEIVCEQCAFQKRLPAGGIYKDKFVDKNHQVITAQHEFSQWRSVDSCTKKRSCKFCNQEEKVVTHNMVFSRYEKDYVKYSPGDTHGIEELRRVNRCKVCGKEERER